MWRVQKAKDTDLVNEDVASSALNRISHRLIARIPGVADPSNFFDEVGTVDLE